MQFEQARKINTSTAVERATMPGDRSKVALPAPVTPAAKQ
jgi:hypothetical protein